MLVAFDNDPKLIELLTAAYTYLDRFVDVEEALVDGFDLAAWCREADALGIPPRTGAPHARLESRLFGLSERVDETGYPDDDPKHPTYHDRMADVWDTREDK